jgi:hypothetical protein
MLNVKIKLILAVSVLALGGFSAAYGQMEDDIVLRVNIPNQFIVKDKTFAPGVYTIRRTPNKSNLNTVLTLGGEDGSLMYIDTRPTRTHNEDHATQLIFTNVGGNYFLSAILFEGNPIGNEIPGTRAQREMIARYRSRPRIITLRIS